jgi:fermentation-respiration switch protein FrsA (DUF1100 family)
MTKKDKSRPFMELAWSIIKIAGLAYAGFCLIIYFRQASYVYYPDKTVDSNPEDVNLAFETVNLKTADGETVAGWFVPAGREKNGTVLFCHGNAGDIGDRLGSIITFHAMDLNVMIFDYQGYGRSSGKPTEKGTYHDVRAAWDYLTKEKGFSAESIIVFGRSLGGAVAIDVAEEVNPGMLVVESTFTSAPDMASRMFPFLPSRLVCRFKYDSIDKISNVKCPILIAHSSDDDMIPYAHGKRLFEAANDPRLFVDMTGPHNAGGLDMDKEYQKKLKDFLSLHLNKAFSSPYGKKVE